MYKESPVSNAKLQTNFRPVTMKWKPIFVHILLWCLQGISSIERDVTFPIEAQKEECFFEHAIVGQIMEIDYQIIDGGSDGLFAVDFSITGPDGKPLVMETEKAENNHQVTIEVDGDYKICFDNKKSRSGSKLIFFELLLDNDGDQDLDYDDLAPDDDYGDEVEEMGQSLKLIKERITKSRHLQEQIRAHEFKDRSIAERNFERINFWSLVQAIVMVVAGLSQVMMIRSIFDEKSPIRKIFK